jgi:hypothetical protein
MRERLLDPVELARVRDQLRPRGPTSVACSECGATFLSTLQGASSRGVVLCSKRCRNGRKQAARRAANIGTAEIMARVTIAARRRGPRGAKYDLVVARLSQMAGAGLATLTAADRHLVQRYFGLGGVAAASLRQLATETNLARSAIARRCTRAS